MEDNFGCQHARGKPAMSESVVFVDEFDGNNGLAGGQRGGFPNAGIGVNKSQRAYVRGLKGLTRHMHLARLFLR